jgi:hypothetical protein
MGSLGCNKVYLEIDFKMVVDDANNMKSNQSEYGSIIVEPYLVTVTSL